MMTIPPSLTAIETAAEELNFRLSCDVETGSFLRTLVRAKPAGHILEIGTGAGVSTCWLLDGMDESSTLVTIDADPQVQTVAQQYLSHDKRVNFKCVDGGDFIRTCVVDHIQFDFIFADSWPGKFYLLEETLSLLKSGGIYFVDDLNEKPTWPSDHPDKVINFIANINAHNDFITSQIDWSTGLMIAVKK